MNGPKSDVILARLTGEKVEYTGVVAGMSGSPVYIDGKLVGAIAFRIGQFSKEPIAGITPIENMLEIDQLDQHEQAVSAHSLRSASPKIEASATSSAGSSPDLQSYEKLIEPIAAPLVFTGFSEDTLRQFSSQFAAAGVVPVMGAGSVSDQPQPEPIEPGSAVSAVLVRGDMNIAATCTVTWADANRLLACGHPLMQFGNVDMPMTKADVVATLASPMNAFKIVNTTETVGAFTQDRHTGILGRFGEQAQMIPVTLTLHGGPEPKSFHYEVLNSPKLTPVAMMATVFNALHGMNEYGDNTTYRLRGTIDVKGYPSVQMQNMFAPSDTVPTAMGVALSVGDRFGRIFSNDYQAAVVEGVHLDLDVVHERRFARLATARTDVTEARPGDEVVIEAVLQPYRGDRIVRQIPVRIPTSTPRGQLRILVSDADTLDRSHRINPKLGTQELDLGATISSLNKERNNSYLYVSLLEPNPQAMIEDKVMPTLPLSVLNVMDGTSGSQEMVLSAESAVDESSTPIDYVVSGAQLLTINIK
jgi:hypothetical protein